MWAIAPRKWALWRGRIGIINAIKLDPVGAEFHLVGPDGTTSAIVMASIGELRPPKADQIPECRRAAPDVMRRLGYL
jgi:hypothetical protein